MTQMIQLVNAALWEYVTVQSLKGVKCAVVQGIC